MDDSGTWPGRRLALPVQGQLQFLPTLPSLFRRKRLSECLNAAFRVLLSPAFLSAFSYGFILTPRRRLHSSFPPNATIHCLRASVLLPPWTQENLKRFGSHRHTEIEGPSRDATAPGGTP